MKQPSNFNYVQLGLINTPSERNAIGYMRENIKELNRSMENIQKMIERSRSIIRNSRNSSLNQKGIIEKKQAQKLDMTKPVQDNYIKLEENQGSPLKAQPLNQLSIYSTEKKSNLSTNSKLITHVISPSPNNFNAALNVVKSPNNRCNSKFNTLQKKEVNLHQQTRCMNMPLNKLNQTAIIKQRLISMSKSIQKLQKQSPFKEMENRDKKIYQLSPQKTNKNEAPKSTNRLNAKLAPSNIEKHVKIKIKPSHNYTNSQQVKPQMIRKDINISNLDTNQKGKDMIRIQDDQESGYDNKSHEQMENRHPQTEVKQRYKTEFQEDKQDLSYDYKIHETDNKNTVKKQTTRKINLKGAQNTDTNKKNTLTSQSRFKKGETSRACNRQTLVKQLEELQTISENDEERRSKFLMKIKKYGFVDKYLSESQIWALYDELTQSKISELKWPIVIVDEVYKKMKISK